jgi:hypothetical protein
LHPATRHTTNTLTMPSGHRFGFNNQEKDNEVAGSGNSYTAEYWQYDARLGRRWNVDPVVKVWESPYAAFANNPILYVDYNGDDNIVYLVVLPTRRNIFTLLKAYKIAREANKYFEALGLKTRVVVVDKKLTKGQLFDPNKIDKTDRVAVFGEHKDVIEYVKKHNKTFGKELEAKWEGGSDNPERSENPNHAGGKFIAVDATSLQEFGSKLGGLSEIQAGAITIMHGVGHTSTLDHAYFQDKDENPGANKSLIMFSATALSNRISQTSLSDVLKQHNNIDYIGAVSDAKTGMGNNDA